MFSNVGTVSQAVPAAMLQVGQRQMRIRRKSKGNKHSHESVYELANQESWHCRQSHKLDGIRIERIRIFELFSSYAAYI